MKTRIQGIFMAIVAIAIFSFTMLTNMTKDQTGHLKFSPMVAMADGESGGNPPSNECFTKTVTDCPFGGQRVSCDINGSWTTGNSCTPVNCTTGEGSPLSCPAPSGG